MRQSIKAGKKNKKKLQIVFICKSREQFIYKHLNNNFKVSTVDKTLNTEQWNEREESSACVLLSCVYSVSEKSSEFCQ